MLGALGCATAGSRSELVRERAELDLGCPAQLITIRELPDDYIDEQLWGGSYEAEGCGTRGTYQLDHCGLGAAPNGCSAIAKSGPGVGAKNIGETDDLP
jgi:hypothetical protein